MSKIVFIEPKAPNLHIFSQYTLPRLGIFILGTLMQKRGWEVEIIVEELQPVNYESLTKVDLVGISTITPTAPRAYAIADRLKSMGIPVVMGGPHVTFLPEEALRHCDWVIRGEGEKALMLFIDSWERKKVWGQVPNLSFRSDDRIIHNPMGQAIKDLDDIPFVDYALLNKVIRKISGFRIIPIQTSRGCPFDCSFCSVTGMFGRRYRYRSVENIISELRQYDSRKNFVFFYDDNFTANRGRTKTLLNRMIEEKFKFHWSTQVRVDIAKDPELVKLMQKAHCHTLFIGFESINPAALKAIKKEQTVEDIKHSIKVIRKHNILIHGMFIYGFDEDNWETVRKTVRFAKRSRLSSVQFLILTPLPGTQFYDKIVAEKRLKFRDWSLYDAHHAVFKPANFTFSDLQAAQIFSHKKFYSFWGSVRKALRWKLVDVAIARYARQINRNWRKKNEIFLKVLKLLTPNKIAGIDVDYRENIYLDERLT